eukprot:g450.t1
MERKREKERRKRKRKKKKKRRRKSKDRKRSRERDSSGDERGIKKSRVKDETESSSEEDAKSAQDVSGAKSTILEMLRGLPALASDLKCVFKNIDDGCVVHVDDIANAKLREGLRDVFVRMGLTRVEDGGFEASNRGSSSSLMQNFGNMLSDVEKMWQRAVRSGGGDGMGKEQRGMDKTKEEDAKSENLQADMSVPSLPPTTTTTTTTIEENSTKRTLGPVGPPPGYIPPPANDTSSSSEDEFGPVPATSRKMRLADPRVVEAMRRKERMMRMPQSAVESSTSGRPEWMTQVPDALAGSSASSALFRRGGKTQFRQHAAKKVDSSWTETIQEKAERALRKQRADILGLDVPLPTSSKTEREANHRGRRTTNDDVVAAVEQYNLAKRPKSLLEVHREKMSSSSGTSRSTSSSRKTVSSKTPATWDRERDMSIMGTSKKMGDRDVSKLVSSSSGLSSRFSH